MPTPLPQLLAAVPSLNRPDQPFAFAVEDDRIVGRWLIQHAAFAGLRSAEAIDDRYAVSAIPTGEGEYRLEEVRTEHEAHAGSRGGTLSIGGSKRTFKGKQFGVSKGMTIGPNVSQDGPGLIYTWSFETRLIKEPLLAFLAANGWQERKGLFGRLFG